MPRRLYGHICRSDFTYALYKITARCGLPIKSLMNDAPYDRRAMMEACMIEQGHDEAAPIVHRDASFT